MIPDAILQKLRESVGEGRKVCVGYSGGLDSSVLLDQVCEVVPKNAIAALHVNHGLSAYSNDWEEHCQSECERQKIAFYAERVQVVKANKGIEDAARNARYRAFQKHVSPGDILLLAHHANDQAETVLFRFLRGTGLRGASGIHQQRLVANLDILRPLLHVTRRELELYAQHKKLSWIEDESNLDERFDRNFIRQRVIPLLETRWPQAAKKIAESASHAAQNLAVLNDYLDQELVSLSRRKERLGESIDLAGFTALPKQRANLLLQRWCESLGVDIPNSVHLAKLFEVIAAKEDAKPCLNWGRAELRRFDHRLYLLPSIELGSLSEQNWHPSEVLRFDNGFTLSCLNHESLSSDTVFTLRSRNNSERCRPIGRAHRQTVKKLLQEHHLEPWLRDCVPFVYLANELVAVPGVWNCEVEGLSIHPKLEWSHPSGVESGATLIS
jgi:tRNA(Ile)-lysidine synthase